jgi:hypothetical protein
MQEAVEAVQIMRMHIKVSLEVLVVEAQVVREQELVRPERQIREVVEVEEIIFTLVELNKQRVEQEVQVLLFFHTLQHTISLQVLMLD